MSGSARQWVDVNGARLRYDHRRGTAGTIVLLHHMGGALESYDALLPGLGGHWSTLRYDQRGAGLSDKISGSLSIDTAAADLEALLDALSIDDPVVLVGTAVGAAVAIRFATRYPARTKALALLAPSTGLIAERRAVTLERIAQLEARALAAQHDDLGSSGNGSQVGDLASQAATWRMLIGLDLRADLAAIGCPTLVVAGTRDVDRPPGHVSEVAGKIAAARLLVLDTGHIMAVETPDLVATALVTFLDEIGFR